MTNSATLDQLLLVERVIGSAMLDAAILARLAQAGVSVHEFEHDKHREMWRAIMTCFDRLGSADSAVVAEALVRQQKWDAGDAKQWVSEAVRSAVTGGRVDDETIGVYAGRLRHSAAMRRARKLADRMYQLAEADIPAPQIAADVSAELDSIVSGSNTRRAKSASSITDDILKDLMTEGQQIERFPLGLGLIDKAMNGGARAGSVVVVGADTGVGKTTFGQHMLLSMGRAGIPAVYFTFETKATHLMSGVVQMQARRRIIRPLDRFAMSQFNKAIDTVRAMPLWVEDSESMTVEEIQSAVHAHVKANGVRVVFIDYVQDVDRSTRHSRDDLNYAHVSKVLRRVAQRYNVLIVEFAQLADTREAQRTTKGYVGPTEADIAYTRQFAKDASYVVMLHRIKLSGDEGSRHRTAVRLTKNRWESTLTSASMRYDPGTTELHPCDDEGRDLAAKTVTKEQDHDEIDDDGAFS